MSSYLFVKKKKWLSENIEKGQNIKAQKFLTAKRARPELCFVTRDTSII